MSPGVFNYLTVLSHQTLSYPKRIALYDPTHMMNLGDTLAILSVETLRIDNMCSLEREFTELIYVNC